MEKAFRNPLFLTGLPMAICGLGIGFPAFLILGLASMVTTWGRGAS
ncbi:hypothetical protein [Pseudomonas baetica]|nr:hypothetical protein [Pseudomonas baetica]MDF9773697.1 hypothetical protein [Pseudomonas baetica]